MHNRGAGIIGIGTALPRYCVPQADVGDWLQRILPDRRAHRLVRGLFRGPSIQSRHMVIPDALPESEPVLYRDSFPLLADRMRIYRKEAPALALQAAERALADASLSGSDITHLVVVTNTGAYTPGPEAEIAHRLGIDPGRERMLVSMMGCHGAFPGLRVARRIAEQDPEARVLFVSVELCSIHVHPHPTPGEIVAFSLFGDAAAALVLQGSAADTARFVTLGTSISRVERSGRDLLRWDLVDDGFHIELSKDLPDSIAQRVSGFVAPLVTELGGGSDPARVGSWCVHPGGVSILQKVQDALGLPPGALETSFDILQKAGNISSASILFILQQELDRLEPGDPGILLGFGPGLTFEGLAVYRGGRSVSLA